MVHGDRVKFTYKNIFGVENQDVIVLSDDIMSEIVMSDEDVHQRLTADFRRFTVQEMNEGGIIFAARNLLKKYPEALEISMWRVNGSSEENETHNAPYGNGCDTNPAADDTYTPYHEKNNSTNIKKSSGTAKKAVIAVAVLLVAALIGFGVYWFFIKDSDGSDGVKDKEEETTAPETEQSEHIHDHEDEDEDEDEETGETTAQEEDEKVEEIDIRDYVGFWHMDDVLEKELTIIRERNGSVYFSLEYYDSDKITDVAAELRGRIASFALADGDTIINGELIFGDGTVTVSILESTRQDMPSEMMVFNVWGRTSTLPLEEDKEDDTTDDPGENTEEEIGKVNTDTPYKVVIANGGLNMRSSPSTTSSVLTLISNGAIVSVEKVENNWAYVYYNGNYGWCSCDYLFYPYEHYGAPIRSAIVRCTGNAEMVSDDYIEKDLVYTDIPNGTTVSVYIIEGDKAFIKYNNIYGWLPLTYLELQ
ncbi:MAG: SH3 domain-containing protein [Ruminococcaceae bacterium]|nr:SH3 domain-containing protein [Oscillospiraceae bacterium]